MTKTKIIPTLLAILPNNVAGSGQILKFRKNKKGGKKLPPFRVWNVGLGLSHFQFGCITLAIVFIQVYFPHTHVLRGNFEIFVFLDVFH